MQNECDSREILIAISELRADIKNVCRRIDAIENILYNNGGGLIGKVYWAIGVTGIVVGVASAVMGSLIARQ